MTHAPPLRCVRLPSGVELHCLESGAGPPLLLLHGGLGDCRSWAAQIEPFARHFRVVAFSRRHSSPNSNRDPAEGHSPDLDTDDLVTFAQHLQLGPAHLVGTSYGALVALLYALRQPAKVLSLALAEPPLHRWACRTPAGTALHAAFMNEVWLPGRDAFVRGEPQRALQLLADGIWGRPVFDALSAERRQAALRNAAAMKALTLAADPFPDLPRAEVARLAMPVLLVHGEHASALHIHVIDELARVLPNPSRAVIPAAGHGSPAENPAAFNAAVLGFLREPWAVRRGQPLPHLPRKDPP